MRHGGLPDLDIEAARRAGIRVDELGLRHGLERQRGNLEQRVGDDLNAVARPLQVSEGHDARLQSHEAFTVAEFALLSLPFRHLQAYTDAMPPTRRKRVSLFLDVDLLDGLSALKARDGIAAAEAIRRAIAAFLADKGIELPAATPTRRTR